MQQVQIFLGAGTVGVVPARGGDPGTATAGITRFVPFGENQDAGQAEGTFIQPSATADGFDTGGVNGYFSMAGLWGFNGTEAAGLDRLRTLSAVNTPNTNPPPGVMLVRESGTLFAAHAPAANTAMSISLPAVPGQRYIIHTIQVVLTCVAAQAAAVNVALNTTGAGFNIARMVGVAGTNEKFSMSGMNIAADLGEAVTLTGGAPAATNFITGFVEYSLVA